MKMNRDPSLEYYTNLSLESKRVITRPVNKNDIEPWSDFFSSEEATEFFLPLEFATNKEKSNYWIDRQLQRYKELKFGLHAIEERDSKEFIGLCGLLAQDIDGSTQIEVGYSLLKKHWGKGFAPETTRLFINYAFENKISDSVISIIHVKNLRSQRVAEKNGLKIEKRILWNDLDVFIFRITAADFSKQF